MPVVDPDTPYGWTRTDSESSRKQQFRHEEKNWYVTIVESGTGMLTVYGSRGPGEMQYCRTLESPKDAEMHAHVAMQIVADPGAIVAKDGDIDERFTSTNEFRERDSVVMHC